MALVGVSDYSGGLAGPGAEEDLLAQWERSQGSPSGISQPDFSRRDRSCPDQDGLGSPSGPLERSAEAGSPFGALGSSPGLDLPGAHGGVALDPSGGLDRELSSLTGQLPGLCLDPAELSPWGQRVANPPPGLSDGAAIDWCTGLAHAPGSEASGSLVSHNLSPLLAGAFAADPLLVYRDSDPTSLAQPAPGPDPVAGQGPGALPYSLDRAILSAPLAAGASPFPLSGELQRLR